VAGLAAIMVFTVYRFHAVRLEAIRARNELLEQQVGQLNTELDYYISKQMKASSEVEKMRQVKQQLLSVMSHEIRTPMNGIMGMSSLLKETSLTEEQREYADIICNCGESLLTKVNEILADDILNLSKINTEEQQSEYKDIDLRSCVEEVLQMFAVKTANAGLDLVYYMDENVPFQIIGDCKRLQQVLVNLVENAIKFTRHGEIYLNISTLIHGVNKPELIFEVRDTGVGISNDQIKKLFKGIPGLGLVICKKLALLMGGNIEVKSQPGTGSNFIFSIPLVPSLKPIGNKAHEESMSCLEGKHILIADDNLTQRIIFMKQMKAWKAIPFLAATGKQALGILSQDTKIDLILVDINMADIPGITLAKSIKDLYPSIPIILMNIAENESYKQEEALFSSILPKPIRQSKLKDCMIDVFSKTNTDKRAKEKKLPEDFSTQYPLHILIAEDNIVNQKLAIKMLNKLGYQPHLARNGKEVMEMISHEHYDIILMDVQMSEMDGLEATRMIRTCLEVQPVIIAMTANVMMGDRDECIQAGMDDYISKPFEPEELLNQFEKWFLAIKQRRKTSAL
jgi:signal transduction histidine kinase/DNA-binding response OmpR family regulator